MGYCCTQSGIAGAHLLHHVDYYQICDQDGCAALQVAAQDGFSETVKFLIDASADLDYSSDAVRSSSYSQSGIE